MSEPTTRNSQITAPHTESNTPIHPRRPLFVTQTHNCSLAIQIDLIFIDLQMPPSRTPRKEYKRTLRPRNVRSGRRSDVQENPQGSGGSSVAVSIAYLMPMGSGWSLTVITQLDIEAGDSQNSSDRQSIANSYNTTARDTTSNCGNTTTTNSNNTTTDNSRAYKESNHNEFLNTKVNGPVGIGSPACSVLRRGNTLADTQRFSV